MHIYAMKVDPMVEQQLSPYRSLASHPLMSEALDQASWPAPQSWYMVCSDVVNSTAAIAQGKYKLVNVAGALPIIALGRALRSLDYPFVFGGDGFMALIPPAFVDQAKALMQRCARDVAQWFDLELRLAAIPLHILNDQGPAPLKLGRHRVSPLYTQAVFCGPHGTLADQMMKDGQWTLELDPGDSKPVDYTGFTCRWNDVPTSKDYTCALVVQPRQGQETLDLLRHLESSLARGEYSHPLEPRAMEYGGSTSTWKLKPLVEGGGKKGLKYWLSWIEEKLTIAVVRWGIRHRIPIRSGPYQVDRVREQNIESSDHQKIDGAIKIVLSLDQRALDKLQGELERLYGEKRIFYGLHTSSFAHLTCIAQVEAGQDIHFVDAGDGGYTSAAMALKRQLAQSGQM